MALVSANNTFLYTLLNHFIVIDGTPKYTKKLYLFNLLILTLSQAYDFLFSLNTKEDIVKNVGNQRV